LFTDLVKSLPADIVNVAADGESLSIKSKGGDFTLPTADPDDYPQLPKLSDEKRVSLPASQFAGLVKKVVDFVSPEDNRPDLNGVLLEFRGKDVRSVATNGHLMAVAGVDGKFPKGEKVIVLPSALNYAVQGRKATELIELGIAKTQIVIEIANLTVFSRLLESNFPNYEDVIPAGNTKKLVVRRDEMLQALRRVDIVADNLTHQVRFKLEKGFLTLDAQQSMGGGKASVKVEAQYDDDPLEIGFNAKYVMDILKTVDAEEVELSLDTPLSAAVMRPHPETAGVHHVCLVMPLRLTPNS
jgi:DNA polymerase-3 subunit beta